MGTLSERLHHVAVIGAAGKMGRGIALLLLQEMARQEAERTGQITAGRVVAEHRLVLIDADDQRLSGLWDTFKPALTKYAIQNINALRRFFAPRSDLIENGDMIAAFVEGAFRLIRLSSDVTAARGCRLVFEAVAEDFFLKRQLFQSLKPLVGPDAIYCTNTSSIPIGYLDAEAQLGHRLIGFHFYNPPPLQKLVELIPAEQGAPDLLPLAQELGQRLGKTLVVSRDVAGFIGNGHFMRELCYAAQRVKSLSESEQMPLEQTIYLLNRVTQHLLLRPMGIFQLVDYVGLDVCQAILAVMECHLHDATLRCELVDQMLAQGVKGGQEMSGSQRPGFFEYHHGQPVALYNLARKRYEPLEAMPWKTTCDQTLAPLHPHALSWNQLIKDPGRHKKLHPYFQVLFQEQTLGAQEAQRYLRHSRAIAEQLVRDRVAADGEAVNQVLELGFAHLYGPMNPLY